MQAALGQVEAQYQKQVEALDQSMRAIDKNVQLSSKVIQIANVLTLAMAIYDVARIPVVGGGSGIGTSGPPRIPAFNISSPRSSRIACSSSTTNPCLRFRKAHTGHRIYGMCTWRD